MYNAADIKAKHFVLLIKDGNVKSYRYLPATDLQGESVIQQLKMVFLQRTDNNQLSFQEIAMKC